jgi:hypothetical protein
MRLAREVEAEVDGIFFCAPSLIRSYNGRGMKSRFEMFVFTSCRSLDLSRVAGTFGRLFRFRGHWGHFGAALAYRNVVNVLQTRNL